MTNPTICRSTWIKFKDKNEQAQHLTTGDVDGAHYMHVEANGGVLQVSYVFFDADKQQGKILKVINWLVVDLKEWYCENIVN